MGHRRDEHRVRFQDTVHLAEHAVEVVVLAERASAERDVDALGPKKRQISKVAGVDFDAGLFAVGEATCARGELFAGLDRDRLGTLADERDGVVAGAATEFEYALGVQVSEEAQVAFARQVVPPEQRAVADLIVGCAGLGNEFGGDAVPRLDVRHVTIVPHGHRSDGRADRGRAIAWNNHLMSNVPLAAPAGESDPTRRFDELDGLRALAMTAVFVYHFGLFSGPLLALGPSFGAAPTTWGSRVIPNLQMGVEVFFVLSGFLIYAPFARARAERQPGPALRHYAIRRALRIYPAYWLALSVLLVRDDIYVNGFVNYLKHASLTHLYWSDFGKVGTREPGMVVAWTLVVEVSFYVFVPMWAALARRMSVRLEVVVLAALAIVGLLVRWWAVDHRVWPWVHVLPSGFAALGPGMLMAIAMAHRTRWSSGFARLWRRRWPWHLAAIGVFVAMSRLAYGSVFFAILSEGAPLLWHKVLAPIFAIALVAPIVLGSGQGWRVGGRRLRLLANPVLVWIGTVSYGGYLWHHSLMYHHVDQDAVNDMSAFNVSLLMVGLFAFVLAVAAGSWYLVERPALRLANRLTRVGGAGAGGGGAPRS